MSRRRPATDSTDRLAVATRSRPRSWPLLLFGVAITLPFLNKPFHIDDGDYLAIARQIVRDPFDPYGLELVRGGRWYHAGAVHPSPPLFCYLLAAAVAVFGESEIPLHALSGAFVVWGVWLAGRLGGRFAGSAWPAAILIIASPMVLPGQNVMLDVPMLVLCLAAVEAQLRGVSGQGPAVSGELGMPAEDPGGKSRWRWRLASARKKHGQDAHATRRSDTKWPLIAGLLLAAAFLTKYPAGLLVPPLALYWWQRCRRIPLAWCAGLVVPAAAWLAFDWVRYHPSPAIGRAVDWPGPARLLANAVSLLVILGGTCLASPLALRLPGREKGGWWTAGGGAIGALACVLHRVVIDAQDGPPPLLELVLRASFGGAGGVLLAGAALAVIAWQRATAPQTAGQTSGGHESAVQAPQHAAIAQAPSPPSSYGTAERNLLVTWLALDLAFNLVVQSTTVRHAMLLLPPLVLLLLRAHRPCSPLAQAAAERPALESRRASLRCGLACGFSLVLALGLAHADWEFARGVRRLGSQLAERATPNTPIYAAGDWGVGYYAPAAGLIPIHERTPSPQPPALVAVPLHTYATSPTALFPELAGRLVPLGTMAAPTGLNPLRTIARGANYYHVGTRNLPWSLSREPWETFVVYDLPSKSKGSVSKWNPGQSTIGEE